MTIKMRNIEAELLAQFVKRIGWLEIRGNAVDDDEAHAMVQAILTLQDGLARAGYSPR